MSAVGELEARTQRRVIEYFRDQLGYRYLGNWHERPNNRNIEEDLLKQFLERQGHNPAIITKALEKLGKAAALGGSKTLYAANHEVYGLLRYGAKISPGLGEHTVTVSLIDWDDPAANDFAIAEEVTVEGNHTKRPDIVLYVNGIAVGILELKRSTVSVAQGIRQNLDNQKKDFIRAFFTTVQLVMAGNESEGLRYGVIETREKYWLRWKEADAPDTDAPLQAELGYFCAPRPPARSPARLRGLRCGRQENLPSQPVLRREGGTGLCPAARGRGHLAHPGQRQEPHDGVAGEVDP